MRGWVNKRSLLVPTAGRIDPANSAKVASFWSFDPRCENGDVGRCAGWGQNTAVLCCALAVEGQPPGRKRRQESPRARGEDMRGTCDELLGDRVTASGGRPEGCANPGNVFGRRAEIRRRGWQS